MHEDEVRLVPDDSILAESSPYLAQQLVSNPFSPLWETTRVFLDKQVTRVLGKYGLSLEERDDIVQDSILSVHLNLLHFRGRSRFSTWLTSIAISKVHDYTRSLKSRKEYPLDEAKFQASNFQIEAECILRLNLYKAINHAIKECTDHINPTRDAIAIHYYFYRGFSIKEIASELCVDLDEIRGLINRTKRGLRNSPFLSEFLNSPSIS